MGVENPKLKYLEDVPWEKLLKLSNGKIVRSLEQLPVIIQFSDDETFLSHVSDQKNDFSTWIRDVVGYQELADKIFNIRDKEGFLNCISQSIIDVKNYVPPAVPVVSPKIENPSSVSSTLDTATVPAQIDIQITNPITAPAIAPVNSPPAASVNVPLDIPANPVTANPNSIVIPSASQNPAVVTSANAVSANAVSAVNISSSTASAATVSATSTSPVPSVSISQSAPVVTVIAPSKESTTSTESISSSSQNSASAGNMSKSASPGDASSTAQASSTPVVSTTASLISGATPNNTDIQTDNKIEAKVESSKEAVTSDIKPSGIESFEIKPEEIYEFEEVFKVLLDDMANEVFVWDTQSG